MYNLRHVISVGLAAATLAVVLTYVLGAEAILQSPYAEPSHKLFMSLKEGIAGPEMHRTGDQVVESPNYGIIGNNVLGGPVSLSAGGLAAVVIYSVIPLATAAFLVSWKQRSFVVAGLLAASGIILVILALSKMNFVYPGPIIGVVVGLVILGLGVTKCIRTASAVTIASR